MKNTKKFAMVSKSNGIYVSIIEKTEKTITNHYIDNNGRYVTETASFDNEDKVLKLLDRARGFDGSETKYFSKEISNESFKSMLNELRAANSEVIDWELSKRLTNLIRQK